MCDCLNGWLLRKESCMKHKDLRWTMYVTPHRNQLIGNWLHGLRPSLIPFGTRLIDHNYSEERLQQKTFNNMIKIAITKNHSHNNQNKHKTS
jgi:hypothetical protein